MQLGYGQEDWVGKPVIAIINTWSDVRTFHGHCMTMGTASATAGIAKACPARFQFPPWTPTMSCLLRLVYNAERCEAVLAGKFSAACFEKTGVTN